MFFHLGKLICVTLCRHYLPLDLVIETPEFGLALGLLEVEELPARRVQQLQLLQLHLAVQRIQPARRMRFKTE